MKKTILLFPFLLAVFLSHPQGYLPAWESLDKRPVPQWFKDGKFGIFIHWGVYSVPGFSSKGSYAEWYQNGLNSGDSVRIRFHQKKFGNLSYYQLADQFKAELFNPDEWARLFERSGATYIVLTSKHHDGFALWPSKEASRTWGFPWNAVEAGPHRDLLGDLFQAVRKTRVHAGMYYSLYEWYNPLWKADHRQFAQQHTWPQMKDLINTYQPDVFWTDGDWDAKAEDWKSQEFLAWLYNESPVRDRVVVNDRWGAGIRFRHGGIYTPEYQPDLDFEDHYWEESRGMGFSYGYNRLEDAWDYNSSRSLVLQLIDKVSRGGNFLLDIGPDEHGKIPPIMQERLLEIGDWLKINGEAIYNSSRWRQPSQWSEGNRHYVPGSGSGDLLLKLTLDPDPGYAVKEIFFTYNEKQNNLYAIFPRYPQNLQLLLKEITLPAGTPVELLPTAQKLEWKQEGGDVRVTLPAYLPEKFQAPYAFVLKIGGFGRFTPKPALQLSSQPGSLSQSISISGAPGSVIHFTLDGSLPGPASPRYEKPLPVKGEMRVRARAWADNALASAPAEIRATEHHWLAAQKPGRLSPGIHYRYAQPDSLFTLQAAATLPALASGITDNFSLREKKRPSKFTFDFEGYLRIDEPGIYTFFCTSDDGSQLLVDGTEIVNNDGNHGAIEQSGQAALARGFHKIRLLYFDSSGENSLRVDYALQGGERAPVPARLLFHKQGSDSGK